MYSAFRAVADIHDEAEKYGVKVRDMHKKLQDCGRSYHRYYWALENIAADSDLDRLVEHIKAHPDIPSPKYALASKPNCSKANRASSR